MITTATHIATSRPPNRGPFSPHLGEAIEDAITALDRVAKLAGQSPLAGDAEELQLDLLNAVLKQARRSAGVPESTGRRTQEMVA